VIIGSSKGRAARLVLVAGIALAFGLADAPQSFPGCGGYCEAQQARETCHQAVTAEGLEVRKREAAFERCKADPASYLELQEFTDDTATRVE